jgi:phage host-nuclease inhibitor protein Gam
MKAITDKAKALFGLLKTEVIEGDTALIEVCNEVAKNQLKRDTLMLQRDAEVQAINDKYGAEVEKMNSIIDHDVKRLKAWANTHREARFGKKQSLVIAGHVFEYRKGAGAVKCGDDLKEEDIVDRLMALTDEDLKGTTLKADEVKETLLRVAASLDKDAVKREFRLGEIKPLLEQLGLRVVVNETFTFTPAREELPSIAESSSNAVGATAGREAA